MKSIREMMKYNLRNVSTLFVCFGEIIKNVRTVYEKRKHFIFKEKMSKSFSQSNPET